MALWVSLVSQEGMMKIYIFPVPRLAQPSSQSFMSPPHNSQWGVEQDFLRWLEQSGLTTSSLFDADWAYLPVFWNRCYINYEWGKGKLEELSQVVRSVFRQFDRKRIFTICEYDILNMQGHVYDLSGATVFVASRKSPDSLCIDIPLLCSEHKSGLTVLPPERTWLASFIGNYKVHSPRPEMCEVTKDMWDVTVQDTAEDRPEEHFIHLAQSSYTVLSPRGYGGQSFRFYEAMQLGVVPIHIGDFDPRPFPEQIDWESISIWCNNVSNLPKILDDMRGHKGWLVEMGRKAREVYYSDLAYGKWCRHVVSKLEALSG